MNTYIFGCDGHEIKVEISRKSVKIYLDGILMTPKKKEDKK